MLCWTVWWHENRPCSNVYMLTCGLGIESTWFCLHRNANLSKTLVIDMLENFKWLSLRAARNGDVKTGRLTNY